VETNGADTALVTDERVLVQGYDIVGELLELRRRVEGLETAHGAAR
jgi:hypothetical protein